MVYTLLLENALIQVILSAVRFNEAVSTYSLPSESSL